MTYYLYILKLRLLIITLILFFPLGKASTQEIPFDPEVVPDKSNMRFAYQSRTYGDYTRYEGLYLRPSSSSFEIVSFLIGTLRYDLEEDSVLIVTSPVYVPINVRSVYMTPETHYRMDVYIDTSFLVFEWPIGDVLRPLLFNYWNIGSFGWITVDSRKMYIPINIRTKKSDANPDKIILKIRCNVDLENISWRIYDYPLDEHANFSEWFSANKIFAQAGEIIVIENIPEEYRGKKWIEVSAMDKNDEKWTTQRIPILLPNEN